MGFELSLLLRNGLRFKGMDGGIHQVPPYCQ